jgi:hypothetical protein
MPDTADHEAMNYAITLDLPAPEHSIFTDAAAASLVGQEFALDERIAGVAGLVAISLSADERGLWTRARCIGAEALHGGRIVRVTVELIA